MNRLQTVNGKRADDDGDGDRRYKSLFYEDDIYEMAHFAVF